MRLVALLTVPALSLAACGDSGESPATGPTTPPPVTTAVPTPTTTLAPTTSLALTTTLAPTTTAPAGGAEIVARNDAGMTISAVEEVQSGEGWELALERPRLDGHPDPVVQDRVNARIDALYAGVEADFFDTVADLGEGDRYDVGVSHEVTLFNDDVLSLRYFLFWSSSTAAHPTDDIETLLVDLATGEPYTLIELLSADSAPSALLFLIDRHILDDVLGGDTEMFTSVDGPEPAFGAWALTPTTFDVSYGRYEAGPGVLGSFTVSIPYEELGVLVNPDGPIAALTGLG